MKRIPHLGSGEIVRYLVTFAGPRKWSFTGSCALGILTGLADTVGVAAIVYLLFSIASGASYVSGDGILENLFIRLDAVSQQGPLIIVPLVLLILLVRGAGNLAYMHVARSMSLNAERSIRKALLDRYLSDDIGGFVRKEQGNIINNIQVEATHVADFLYVVSRLFVSISYLAVVFLVVLGTSWQISAAVVLGALIYRTILKYANTRARHLGQEVLVHREKIATHTAGAIRAFKSIKVCAAERQMVQQLNDLSKQYARSMFRLGQVEVLSASVGELALFGILGLILLVAGFAGLHMATTIGVVALIWKARPFLSELERSLLEINFNLASLRSVEKELAAGKRPGSTEKRGNPKTSLSGLGPVKFDNVSFRYSGAERYALEGVTFSIPRGSTCAIMGKSGAGKTTLVNLLLKLAAPGEGRISIGGMDLRDIERQDWLSVTGAAGQDMQLTEDTIRANLTLGLKDVDDAAILRALSIAEAVDVVAGNPDGLDANPGTSGMSLSGGQRQRLVLARALLRRPQLLILDESTNAVDSNTEDKILANIRAAFPDMTLIIIAHRSNVAGHIDYFVELEDGRLKQTGGADRIAAMGGSLSINASMSKVERAVVVS